MTIAVAQVLLATETSTPLAGGGKASTPSSPSAYAHGLRFGQGAVGSPSSTKHQAQRSPGSMLRITG